MTVKFALVRISLELLTALSSTGPGSIMSSSVSARLGENAHRHRKRDSLGRARLQVDAGKPDELLRRKRHAGHRVT